MRITHQARFISPQPRTTTHRIEWCATVKHIRQFACVRTASKQQGCEWCCSGWGSMSGEGGGLVGWGIANNHRTKVDISYTYTYHICYACTDCWCVSFISAPPRQTSLPQGILWRCDCNWCLWIDWKWIVRKAFGHTCIWWLVDAHARPTVDAVCSKSQNNEKPKYITEGRLPLCMCVLLVGLSPVCAFDMSLKIAHFHIRFPTARRRRCCGSTLASMPFHTHRCRTFRWNVFWILYYLSLCDMAFYVQCMSMYAYYYVSIYLLKIMCT